MNSSPSSPPPSLESSSNQIHRLVTEQKLFNLHLKVFKRLLNLKDLQHSERINFFSSIQIHTTTNHQSPRSSINNNDRLSLQPDEERKDAQSHPHHHLDEQQNQLNQLQNQLLESQFLVTCLVHNLQLLRRRTQGVPMVDRIGSDELLNHLRNAHYAGQTSRALFRYQCNEKRKSLRKLRQQLQQTRQKCWQTVRYNLNAPPLLMSSSSSSSSPQSEVTTENRSSFNSSMMMNRSKPMNGEKRRSKVINKKAEMPSQEIVSVQQQQQEEGEEGPTLADNQHRQSTDALDGCTIDNSPATQAKATNRKLNELLQQFDRRKEKLDRLEADCKQFLRRLEHRYSESIEKANQDNEFDEHTRRSEHPIIGLLLENGTSDDEELRQMGFERLERLQVAEELLNELGVDEDDDILDDDDDDDDDEMDEEEEDRESDQEETLDDDIGEDTVIDSINVIDSNVDASEVSDDTISQIFVTSTVTQTIAERTTSSPSLPINNSQSFDLQSKEMINIDDNLSEDMLRSTDTMLAETGEPLQLCNLRRRAVEVLASRWRTERAYFEQREMELRSQLNESKDRFEELKEKLNRMSTKEETIKFKIIQNTAFVFTLMSMVIAGIVNWIN